MQFKDEFITRNFTKGRNRAIDCIVIHVMQGDLPDYIKNPYTWFNDPEAKASAHYGISREDEPIRRWVSENDRAWHAGIKYKSKAQIVLDRPNINPNGYTIGIENEGSGKIPPTPIQIVNNVGLIRDITNRYGFPINRYHIIRHDEIRADKACPGMIDVDNLVNIANGINGVFGQTRTLKRGDKGPVVELLQKLMIELGYMTLEEFNTGPGIFGPKTDRAFEEFLSAHIKK